MTYVHMHPSYLLFFLSQGVLLTFVFPAYLKRRFFASQGMFLKFPFFSLFTRENIVTKKLPCSKRIISYHQQQSAIHFTHLSEEGPGLDACNTCSAPLLEKCRWIKLTSGHRWSQIIFPASNVISFLL